MRVLKMLSRLGYTEEEAKQKYENCLAFEALLAPAMFTKEETQKPDYVSKTNNHFTREELLASEGSVPIAEVFEDFLGYPPIEDMLVFEPVWTTKEGVYNLIEDVHPLYYIRIDGILQQYDDFFDFYGIKPGDGMYQATEDRVSIW